jgi:hypothetical protein
MCIDSPSRPQRTDHAGRFEAQRLAADALLAVAQHLVDELHGGSGIARFDRGEHRTVIRHRAQVIAIFVVVERAESRDQLREEVGHELVHQIAGGFAEQRVPMQVDFECALRVGAVGGLLVEQGAGADELLLAAIARRQLHDRERDVAAEHQQLIEQCGRHDGRVAQQRLDHLQRRRRGERLHEGALAVAHLDQLEELEALERLAHHLAIHLERVGELALVRQSAAGGNRAGQDLRAELLEDAVDQAGAMDGLELHPQGLRNGPVV